MKNITQPQYDQIKDLLPVQRHHWKHWFPQRYSVHRWKRLQMAKIAQRVRALVHHLSTYATLGRKRHLDSRPQSHANKTQYITWCYGVITRQYEYQSASRRHWLLKKTAHKPSAKVAEVATQKFTWLWRTKSHLSCFICRPAKPPMTRKVGNWFRKYRKFIVTIKFPCLWTRLMKAIKYAT